MSWSIDFDSTIYLSRTANGKNWAPQMSVSGATSVVGPAMAVFYSRIFMAWKAKDSDHVYIASTTDSYEWTTPYEKSDMGLFGRPALATVVDANGKQTLYMAWRGADFDAKIYWASTTDGKNWTSQQFISSGPTEDVTTERAPALIAFNGRLYAAWRGAKPELLKTADEQIRIAYLDGTNWSKPVVVPNAGSTDSPAMTVFNGKLYMAWKGGSTGKLFPPSETTVYVTRTQDGKSWDTITQPRDVGSHFAPALTVFSGKLYMAWKSHLNTTISYAIFDGDTTWSDSSTILAIGTGDSPAICSHRLNGLAEHLVATWRGV